ncbi:hypothetical protein AK812_SmicGene4852 [Symbiodinium microadriaticum]|uniref:CCHC-type domain-containing protein n=1 Tax=Symbiodinium microadriaticum TaxID=2951 RepID=A0A1Q9EV66_SYMMI|nr:hypothetical protein AK812_SmicGene4852 [Symbiodinium microadriaticum]
MPPKETQAVSAAAPADSGGFQLPWTAIPKFNPGVTDVTEYSSKLQFLAAMWPPEHLPLLAPRAALLCEGTAFKKVSKIPAEKLKSTDVSGIKLLVSTLGGSWGKTALEEKYDTFEKAIYNTAQKADETNDSYLARHDVHFEELLAQGTTLEEIRAYILLRQSQLSAEDRKKIVVEFFSDLQGQRATRTKTYDANMIEDDVEPELDADYMEALIAEQDPDAMQVQGFEEELEGFFQDTPDLQEALVSYLEARQKLLSKKRSRGFWPASSGKGGFKGSKGQKGRGKGGKGGRDQLLARIARSHCRICGAKGHWKAECPQKKTSASTEATTTIAEAIGGDLYAATAEPQANDEVLTQVPAAAMSLAEAHVTWEVMNAQGVKAEAHWGNLLDCFLNQLSGAVRDQEELESVPLDQLGETVIRFGKAMKGRTFQDVIQNETDWVSWMLDHMSSSTKMEHVAFLTYVRRYVEEAEATEATLLQTEGSSETRGASAKATAKSCSQPRPEADVWDVISNHETAGSVLQEQVTVLGERLGQMEHLMQQLIQHVSQTPPST